MATQRSIEMAISVLTEAETETPCMYDTVLHMNDPRVHSENITETKLEQKKSVTFHLESYF